MADPCAPRLTMIERYLEHTLDDHTFELFTDTCRALDEALGLSIVGSLKAIVAFGAANVESIIEAMSDD